MKTLSLNQGTDAWKAWRRGGLGGSDVATILGVAPFEDATLENLLREKTEGWERPQNWPMRNGNLREPEARARYEAWAGCRAQPVCVEHPAAPWVRASLDGLCRSLDPARAAEPPWVLELKVPGWESHNHAVAGVVPPHYLPQCQWQLLATGLDRLDYCSFYSPGPRAKLDRYRDADRLAVVRVAPDPELQAELLERCEAFWARVLERRAELQEVSR